jgi:hypothetical protein
MSGALRVIVLRAVRVYKSGSPLEGLFPPRPAHSPPSRHSAFGRYTYWPADELTAWNSRRLANLAKRSSSSADRPLSPPTGTRPATVRASGGGSRRGPGARAGREPTDPWPTSTSPQVGTSSRCRSSRGRRTGRHCRGRPAQHACTAGTRTARGTSPPPAACVSAPLAPISLPRVKTGPQNPISVDGGSCAADPHPGARLAPPDGGGRRHPGQTGRAGRRHISVKDSAFTGAAPPRHHSDGTRRHPAGDEPSGRPGRAGRPGSS